MEDGFQLWAQPSTARRPTSPLPPSPTTPPRRARRPSPPDRRHDGEEGAHARSGPRNLYLPRPLPDAPQLDGVPLRGEPDHSTTRLRAPLRTTRASPAPMRSPSRARTARRRPGRRRRRRSVCPTPRRVLEIDPRQPEAPRRDRDAPPVKPRGRRRGPPLPSGARGGSEQHQALDWIRSHHGRGGARTKGISCLRRAYARRSAEPRAALPEIARVYSILGDQLLAELGPCPRTGRHGAVHDPVTHVTRSGVATPNRQAPHPAARHDARAAAGGLRRCCSSLGVALGTNATHAQRETLRSPPCPSTQRRTSRRAASTRRSAPDNGRARSHGLHARVPPLRRRQLARRPQCGSITARSGPRSARTSSTRPSATASPSARTARLVYARHSLSHAQVAAILVPRAHRIATGP